MHWNADPVLFSLGGLSIRWYGLFFASAFLAGITIMKAIYRNEGLKDEKIDDLLIYIMLGTVIGARLGHVLFYDPGYYFSHPLSILKIWEGGLASHGGSIGILLAVYLYCKKHEPQGPLWLLDRLSLPIAMAAGLIRLGNFFNSEIVGITSTAPWAIVFERVDLEPRHPVQLYESLSYFLIFMLLLFAYKKYRSRLNTGSIFGILLITIFGSRIFLESFKIRQAAYGHDNLLSVGQWLSIPFVLIGIFLLVRHKFSNK